MKSQDPAAAVTPLWIALTLLTAVNFFNFLDRVAISVLLPDIKRDLSFTDAQLGLLTGLAFSLFYAACAVPIARLADRKERRTIVATALAFWSIMTALCGLAQNFWHLFLTRVGVGVGEAGCLPPSQSLICDLVPLEKRPAAFAFHQAGTVIGSSSGILIASWLGGLLGWRATLIGIGLAGLPVALMLRLLLREPTRGRYDAEPPLSGGEPLGASLLGLWRTRPYVFVLMSTMASGALANGMNQWLPSFYQRSFDVSGAAVGLHLGIVSGVGSGLGILLGGILTTRAAKGGIDKALQIGAGVTALYPFALAAALLSPTPLASTAFLTLAFLLITFVSVPVITAIYSLVPASTRALAGAVNIVFTAAVGFSLGPLIIGAASDALATRFGAESLRYGMISALWLGPLALVALLAASRFARGLGAEADAASLQGH